MAILAALVASISTAALLGAALWLARGVISTRLKASVEHEFDRKLETIRAQLRESEEKLKADLRRRETELAALQSGALTALTSRQVALDKRKLEAIDQLWDSFNSIQAGRVVAIMMSTINFEAAAAECAHNDKAREAFKLMGAGFDPKSISYAGAQRARPFVTPMVWAIYSAYQAIVAHSIARWTILTTGVGNARLVKDDGVKALILAAVPGYKDYLDKYGAEAFYYVLEPLEERLLAEIRNMIQGGLDDQSTIERAAQIVALANTVVVADKKAGANAA